MSKKSKKIEEYRKRMMFHAAMKEHGQDNARVVHFSNESTFSTALRLEAMVEGEVVSSTFKRFEASQRWSRLQLNDCILRIIMNNLVFDLDVNEKGMNYYFVLEANGGFSIGRTRMDGKEDTTRDAWPKTIVYKKDENGELTVVDTQASPSATPGTAESQAPEKEASQTTETDTKETETAQ